MTFDIILLTDTSTFPMWGRGYGAHRLASHLRQNGYSTLVIDFSSALTLDNWQDICDVAVGDNTRMIGFSSTWWPYRHPFKENKHVNMSPAIADWLSDELKDEFHHDSTLTFDAVRGNLQRWIDIPKKINPKIKTLLGGPKVDYYIDMPVDYFMIGLSETQILDFLTDKRRIWPKMIRHDETAFGRDWGWTTCSTKYTELDLILPGELMTFEVARGCKFKCTFCNFSLIGRKDIASYTKTEDTIYNELLDNYNQWGIKDYWLADETFNDNNQKIEAVARAVQRLPFEVAFKTYLRADLIYKDPSQVQMLYEAGVRSCFVGIETFHPEAAKIVGKGMAAEKRKDALHMMRDGWGDKVSIQAGYIIGLPKEEEDHLREQLEWFASEDSPVDLTFFWSLSINSLTLPHETRGVSEFEKDPGKYGYRIPNPDKPTHWERDDGIRNLAHAVELEKEFNERITQRQTYNPDKIRLENGYRNPSTEYFVPLINKLRNMRK